MKQPALALERNVNVDTACDIRTAHAVVPPPPSASPLLRLGVAPPTAKCRVSDRLPLSCKVLTLSDGAESGPPKVPEPATVKFFCTLSWPLHRGISLDVQAFINLDLLKDTIARNGNTGNVDAASDLDGTCDFEAVTDENFASERGVTLDIQDLLGLADRDITRRELLECVARKRLAGTSVPSAFLLER